MNSNVLSYQEFRKMLAWSLEEKIDHSLYIIENFLVKYPNAIVSFSGGVDSTVLLYLTRIIDQTRKGCFINTTNEHSEIVKFVKTIDNIETIYPTLNFKQVIEKYGFPLISKKVANMVRTCKYPTERNKNTVKLYLSGYTSEGRKNKNFILPKKYIFLLRQPFDISEQCCGVLKKRPFNKANKNGMLVGTLANESRLRTINYLKTGCINNNNKRAAPLSIWTKKDIWDFIRKNNIPYCSVYDKGETTTGCAYCGFGLQFDPKRFERLKEKEPKRFEMIMNTKNNGITYREAIKRTFGKDVDNLMKSLF